jgi:hypothetical protein
MLAEIRDGFRGMRDPRLPQSSQNARRAPQFTATGQQGDSSPGTWLPNTTPQDSARPRALPSR